MRISAIASLTVSTLIVAAAICPTGAVAQEQEQPWRTRVGLGPQLVPSYPGADGVSVRPLVDVARSRGDTPFEFEAADESFGFPLVQIDGLAIGPSLGFEGSRTAEDVGAPLTKVGSTFEAGAFIQYQLAAAIRARAEIRKGIGGHRGWIGVVGADYIARDGDDWVWSLGPRVTLSDDRYHQAYFSVSPADAAATGLPVFAAKGGVQAIGLTAGYIRQLSSRWGIYSYAKYDRLIADAGESPIVRAFGSRNQISGGIALTYTFGSNRD